MSPEQTTTPALCPTCRRPRHTAAELVAALRAGAEATREAHAYLYQPSGKRQPMAALGCFDRVLSALGRFEDSCACPLPTITSLSIESAIEGLLARRMLGVACPTDAPAGEMAVHTPSALEDELEEAQADKLDLKYTLDKIAAALHPHWGGTRGHTYDAAQLPGMIAQLRSGRAEQLKNAAKRMLALREALTNAECERDKARDVARRERDACRTADQYAADREEIRSWDAPKPTADPEVCAHGEPISNPCDVCDWLGEARS